MSNLLLKIIEQLPHINQVLHLDISEQDISMSQFRMNELETKVNTQFKEMDKKLIQQDSELRHKVSTRDLVAKLEKNSNEMYFIKATIDSQLKTKADQTQFQDLQHFCHNLQELAETKLNYSQIQEIIQTTLNHALQQQNQQISKLYLPQSQFQAYQQELEKQLYVISNSIDQLLETITNNQLELTTQIDQLKIQINNKSSKQEFQKVKQYMTTLANKEDYINLKQEWELIKMNTDSFTIKCNEQLQDFKQFVIKTDYNILSTATKMDVKLLNEEIAKIEQSIKGQLSDIKSLKRNTTELKEEIISTNENKVHEYSNLIFNHLQSDIQHYFQTMVDTFFKQQDYKDYKQVIQEINIKLQDKLDLKEWQNHKNERPNIELINQLSQFRLQASQDLVMMKLNLLKVTTFFSQALLESFPGTKRREINQIITDLTNLQEISSQRKINMSLDSKLKIQKPLLKPLVVRQKLTEPDESPHYQYQRYNLIYQN